MSRKCRNILIMCMLVLAIALLFFLTLFVGSVSLDFADVWAALTGKDGDSVTGYIVLQSRLPMAVTAILAGASLSAAGLIMQTAFRNPLAGPSILGISSGSSLGVAIVVLAAGMIHIPALTPDNPLIILLGAALGAAIIILALGLLSAVISNGAALLIAGVMISYLCSSIISLLNFFAPSEDVKMFVVWGMGSFSAVTLTRLPVMAILTLISLAAVILLAKPLDAMLLGERYAANLGYDIRRLRTTLLIVSGALTAITTAYCGPIGFIGLIVPHICRGLLATSSHYVIMPASILGGAALALLCNLGSVLPDSFGVIPINSITPVIGVPVIVYLLINRKNLRWMN